MEGMQLNLATLKVSTSNNLLDLLECPICTEAMCPPIYQCTSGHALCSECKAKLTRCPSCQEQGLDIRCLQLEKLTECFEYPCIYHSMGCRVKSELASKRQHEDSCKFRPYCCPHSDDCDFKGTTMDLVLHLKHIHKSSCYNLPIASIDDVTTMSEVTSAVYYYVHNYFFLSLETINSGKYMDDCLVTMTFMGESDEAKKFYCKLEIGNDEHTLCWKGIPLSIRLGRNELNESLVGLAIPKCFFSRFSECSGIEDRYFHVKDYIWNKELPRDSKYYFDFLPFTPIPMPWWQLGLNYQFDDDV